MNRLFEIKATVDAGVDIVAEVDSSPAVKAQTGAITQVAETDYLKMVNRPKIEGEEITGDKHIEKFGVTPIDTMDIVRITG